jgi:hypothetical protein
VEGVQTPGPDMSLAIRAWNLLSNGMGGVDWAGLPYVVALLGIDDIETLINRLGVIKTHRAETSEDE